MRWIIKSFEELTTKELYGILKLRNEVFIVEQNCPYEDCDNKDINSYHIFSMEGEAVKAYLRVVEKGVSYENEVSIGRVAVNSEYRRKGLAKDMLLIAINFIEKELKEKAIRISAQEYVLDLYRSIGFKEVSDIYLEDDIPHMEMLYLSK